MEVYDVAVIGGGVIGCAVIHELTNHGYKCILLEKNGDLVSGASSGNSAMFHTGFDASPGTLEDGLIAKSLPLMRDYMKKHNIPFKKTGAIMIAKDVNEMKRIQIIHQNAKLKGMENLRMLNKNEVLDLEPHLNSDLVNGGLLLQDEMVVDSCLYTVSLAHQALRNGAKVRCGVKFTSATQRSDGVWCLNTEAQANRIFEDQILHRPGSTETQKAGVQTIYSKMVINAGGLYGDVIDMKGIKESKFRITPMKGEFAVFNKEAGNLIKHLVLPVPTESFKGVIAFPSVYGNLVIGPTRDPTTEKDNFTNSKSVVDQLASFGQKLIPKLKQYNVIDSYAGVRPATEFKDYQILPVLEKNWITIGGIRSTGLTASLGISKYVHDLLKKKFKIAPSHESKPLPNKDAFGRWWVTNQGSYVLDGCEYNITHKLMKLGLSKMAKL